VKPSTIRIILSVALSHSWTVHQLGEKNAFLHGTLIQSDYCEQLSGFVDSTHPDLSPQ
jgi:hypothetical protein